MEFERYECHVRVLIALQPCLGAGKFSSSRSGPLRQLPHVTAFSVIVYLFLSLSLFFFFGPGMLCFTAYVELAASLANMIVNRRNATTRAFL